MVRLSRNSSATGYRAFFLVKMEKRYVVHIVISVPRFYTEVRMNTLQISVTTRTH